MQFAMRTKGPSCYTIQTNTTCVTTWSQLHGVNVSLENVVIGVVVIFTV